MKGAFAGIGLLLAILLLSADSFTSTGVAGTGAACAPLAAQWARTEAADSETVAGFDSVAVGGKGGLYAAGSVLNGGLVSLGHGVSARGPLKDDAAFIARYDSSGTPLWARSQVSGGVSDFVALAVDKAGNAYAVTEIDQGEYDFGGKAQVPAAANGVERGVIVKYDASGSPQWAQVMKYADGDSQITGVDVDSLGNVYASGFVASHAGDRLRFSREAPGYEAASPTLAEVSWTAFVAKLDRSGAALWARTVSLAYNTAVFYSIKVDKSGDFFAAGCIRGDGAYEFGSGVSLKGMANAIKPLLVRYSSAGIARWARSPSDGDAECTFRSVRTDAQGNIDAAGEAKGDGALSFGNAATVNVQSAAGELVVVAYSAARKARWARIVDSSGAYSVCRGFAVGTDCLYLTGTFSIEKGDEAFDFGNGIVARAAVDHGYAGFIASYDLQGSAQWVQVPVGGVWGGYVYHAICTDVRGNVLAGGEIGRDQVYDFGNGVTVNLPLGGLVLVKYGG